MAKYVIVPIVEGPGDFKAVPVLLQNWLRIRRYHRYINVHTDGPIPANGKGNLTADYDRILKRGVEHFVRSAMLREPQADIILVILDSDDDAPESLEADLLARARTQVPDDFPIGVVAAKREYEAWLLAAFASSMFRRSLELEGYRLRQQRLPHGMDVEAISDCEKKLAELIDFGGEQSAGRRTMKYQEALHQGKLTQALPFRPFMSRRSPSFGRLLRVLEDLLSQARRRREDAGRRRTP